MSTEMESFTCPNPPSSHGALSPALFFYLSLLITPCLANSSDPQLPTNATTEFIRTSCGVTLYPKLCFKTLSAYASSIQTSPMELANAALCVSLKGAQSSSQRVTKLSKRQALSFREAGAIRDCIENVQDSVHELQQFLVAMKDLQGQGPDFRMRLSDIVTWVSAAITDEDTCVDGFEGPAMKGELKITIRRYILSVAQLTSNALAIIKKF